MGWLAKRFIPNYEINFIKDEIKEYLTKEEKTENEKKWLDIKMKDKLYPILDKLRYGYLKLEDINKDNFKNFHGVFVQEEWDWFEEFKKK